MNFLEKVDHLMEKHEINKLKLSQGSGIPYSTILDWYKKGFENTRVSTARKLASYFGVTLDYLLLDEIIDEDYGKHLTKQISTTENKTTTHGPYMAEVVATKYKRLDRHGKQVVCAVILEEEKRIESEYQWQEPKAVYPLSDYLQTASAGYGDFNDDASYTVVDLVKRPPMGSSFLITINGDSMEPTYHDGDKLFIKAQETLNIGEVGLFAIGSDLYIKEYGVDGLISHNPKYPIKCPEMDTTVKVYGKVLGVCTDDYFGK